MSSPIKVGIVGCGFITQNVHLPALRKCDGVNVVAVCDMNMKLASSVSSKFKVNKAYDDLSDMLNNEGLDMIDVCTSIDTHASVAIQALKAGCHVLTEKPMAANVKEADEEIEVAKTADKKLCVIHQILFHPIILKMKSIVRKGVLGDITRVEIKQGCPPRDYPPIADPDHWWHRLPGGIFGDTLPHPIYLAKEFMGDIELVSVYSSKLGKYKHLPIDEVQILFRSKDMNCAGTVISSCNWPSLWQVDIYGTEYNLHGDLNNSYLIKYDCRTNNGRGIAPLYIRGNISRSYQILANSLYTGIKMLQGQHRGHFVQIRKFIESIRNDTRPPVTGEDDREVTMMLGNIVEQI